HHAAQKLSSHLGAALVRAEDKRAPGRDPDHLGVDVDRLDVAADLDLAEAGEVLNRRRPGEYPRQRRLEARLEDVLVSRTVRGEEVEPRHARRRPPSAATNGLSRTRRPAHPPSPLRS